MSFHSTYRFPFASLPALRIAIFLILGILIGRMSGGWLNWRIIVMLFSAIFLSWILFEYHFRHHLSVLKTTAATLLYASLLILFGAGLFVFDQERKSYAIEQASPLTLYEWETVTIQGSIKSSGLSQSGRSIYEVEVDKTLFPEDVAWHHRYRIRIYGNDDLLHKIGDYTYLKADIRLYAFPEVRNPHDFDYAAWLISRNIVAHGELENVITATEMRRAGWENLRTYVQNNIESLFNEEQVPLAKALMIGYKEELTQEERISFSRAGLSHIMAVSGMHVGFIIAPFWLLIPWLWRRTWGKWIGLALMTFLLIGYAGLTGFSASVSRASIMAWLLTYGKLFHKIRHSVNLLSVAAIILLVIQPIQLFEAGFQLSFSAVLIILLILPEAQKIIPLKYRDNWKGGLSTIILISVIVQLGLFPILTAYFGEFSIAGPLANALVVPLLSIAVPTGLIISLLKTVTFGLSDMIAIPVGWMLFWIGAVADYFGSQFTAYIEYSQTSLLLFVVWVFGVLSAAAIRFPSIRWKLIICLFVSFNLLLTERLMMGKSNSDMVITVLDVGQGDAIHIRTPSGKHLLVDTGRWNPAGNSGDQILLPYLSYSGVEKLDGIILSHPHADHIGGLPALMKTIPIDAIYHSNYPYNSRLYEEYNRLADEKNIPILNVAAGDLIDADPLIRIFVVGPERTVSPDNNPNNHSVAFRIQYGTTSLLFTGDAEAKQEKQLTDRYGDFLDTDFLKAGHHGSRTSSTKQFIKSVKPEIAVVSLAFRNRFNHPNTEAVTNISNVGAKKYFTSLSGALIFKSDGNTIKKAY